MTSNARTLAISTTADAAVIARLSFVLVSLLSLSLVLIRDGAELLRVP